MSSQLKDNNHNLVLFCCIALLLLAYAGDTLATMAGGRSALAGDHNPLLHHLFPVNYIVFSLFRLSLALCILLLFWPAQLRLRKYFLVRPRWLCLVVPFAYHRTDAYFGSVVVITFSVLKIFATIHNIALVRSGQSLLPDAVTISLGIMTGVLLSNGLLYAQHLAVGGRGDGQQTRSWHEGAVLIGGRSTTNRLRWLVVLMGAACGLFFIGTRGDPVAASSVRVERPGHAPIRLRVYLPTQGSIAMPGVIICPALNVTTVTFAQMAIEIARAGMPCAVVDFFGEQPDESRQCLSDNALETASDDLGNAVSWLRTQPRVDSLKIGLVGHSFGASVILNAPATDLFTWSTVLIGMAGDFTRDHPKNVLLLAGLYDEFYPSSRMRRSLMTGTGLNDATPGIVYGKYSPGTARMLQLEPTASHVTEINHPWVIRQTVQWLARSFGGTEKRITGINLGFGTLALWGSLVLVFWAGSLVLSWDTHMFRLAGVVGLAGCAFWTNLGWVSPIPRAALLLWTLPFIIAGYIIAKGKGPVGQDPEDHPLARWACMLGWNLLALHVAYCLTVIGGNLINYIRYPGWIIGIPVFVAINPLLQLLELVQQCLSVLQWYCGLMLLLGASYTICLLELVCPGIILGTIESIGIRILAMTATRQKTGSGRRNILIFVALLVVLVLLGVRRFQEGFLTGDAASTFIGVLLRLALPTVVLFFLIRKIPAFRCLYTRSSVIP